MYCKNCGAEIDDNAVICVKCGVPVSGNKRNVNQSDEGASGGLALVCFFFPLIGLILYCIWNNDYPTKSSDCGKFALYGFLTAFIGSLLLFGCTASQVSQYL